MYKLSSLFLVAATLTSCANDQPPSSTTIKAVERTEIQEPQKDEELTISEVQVEPSQETIQHHQDELDSKKNQSNEIIQEHFSHEILNELLSECVTENGDVSYDVLKTKHSQLKEYLSLVSSANVSDKWSKNQQLAFWINAYNAVTLNLILEHYPINSIMELHGGKAWDVKLITINGTKYSLNDIEHNIIRKQFNEPRIHFAVNCGAKSCPKLSNEAFNANTLDSQLTKQTKLFLQNASKNNIGKSNLELSKIFEWYKADFGETDAQLIEFINTYAPVKINPDTTIKYMEYDWKLNKL